MARFRGNSSGAIARLQAELHTLNRTQGTRIGTAGLGPRLHEILPRKAEDGVSHFREYGMDIAHEPGRFLLEYELFVGGSHAIAQVGHRIRASLQTLMGRSVTVIIEERQRTKQNLTYKVDLMARAMQILLNYLDLFDDAIPPRKVGDLEGKLEMPMGEALPLYEAIVALNRSLGTALPTDSTNRAAREKGFPKMSAPGVFIERNVLPERTDSRGEEIGEGQMQEAVVGLKGAEGDIIVVEQDNPPFGINSVSNRIGLVIDAMSKLKEEALAHGIRSVHPDFEAPTRRLVDAAMPGIGAGQLDAESALPPAPAALDVRTQPIPAQGLVVPQQLVLGLGGQRIDPKKAN